MVGLCPKNHSGRSLPERMRTPSDGLQFLTYLRRRWVAIAVACGVAVLLAGGVSLVTTPRYTATASILIEPPGGNDPRGATSVSAVYLDSLKTYERYASSDTLFVAALNQTGLAERFKGRNIESIKRSVLKVSRPATTMIVEISATLDDAKSAQQLAQHIAEQTVALNRSLAQKSTDDVLAGLIRNADTAEKRVVEAERNKDVFLNEQPVEVVEKEVDQLHQLLFNTEKELSEERTDLARTEAELKGFSAGDGQEDQARWTKRQLEALRASVGNLGTQAQEFDKTAKERAKVLEARKVRREYLEAEIRAARADYESSKTKLADARSSSAYRGERLQILDPGISPEKPSSPNTPLNMLIAFLIALIGSVVYLAARFGYERQSMYTEIPEYSVR
jgi:capsular polysaccharide biosynthesis protein